MYSQETLADLRLTYPKHYVISTFMANSPYPVHRASYQDLPTHYQGPPDPRFSRPSSARTTGEAKSSLHEALEILRHGKWYILGVTALVLSAVALYTFTAEPEYEANTILMVDTEASENAKMLSVDGVISSAAVNTTIESQLLLLAKSLDIANRTVDSLIALQRLPVSGQPLNILTQASSVSELANLLQEEILSISASSENTDAIEIVAVSNSAEEASVIAGIFAAEYVRETQNIMKANITKQRLFHEDEYGKKKEELEVIESQLASLKNREGSTALDEQVSHLVAQIATTESELETARVELNVSDASLASLESEMAGLESSLSESFTEDLDSKIETKQQERADLEQLVDQIYRRNPELRTNPGANPQLRDYGQTINRLNSEISALGERKARLILEGMGNAGDGTSIEYVRRLNQKLQEEKLNNTGKRAQISSLQQRLGSYNNRLKNAPLIFKEMDDLERSQRLTAEMFTHYSSQLEKLKIAEQSVTGFARIMREAIPPEKPEKPQKAINMILGLMLGLMLGVSVAVGRRKLDTKVYSPKDFSHSNINMLGVIPDMRQFIKKEFGKRTKVGFEGREVSTALAALIAPLSPIAEAYRRLFIKLQFSRDDMGIQNLMVTSPTSGAGKSTTSLNLAITSAQAGKRTLVIDADLRRPSIHDKLGLPSGPTLLELVSEDQSRWDAERFFTGVENLYVITGIPVSQPAELLGSPQMMDLIERFRMEFDIVIFDTPPVLGAVDPVLLSRQCDAVIVVASSDGTDMEALNQSIDELRSVNANVLGTVLNRFDPSSMYGYKNTYGYSYGSYGYGSDYATSTTSSEAVVSRS